jgi:hypothetical protein
MEERGLWRWALSSMAQGKSGKTLKYMRAAAILEDML